MKENDYLCAQNNKSAINMDIKKKIQEHGYNVTSLADELNMSVQNLNQQLNRLEGNSALSLLTRIATLFHCSVSELIDDVCQVDIPQDITLSIGGQEITYQREN